MKYSSVLFLICSLTLLAADGAAADQCGSRGEEVRQRFITGAEHFIAIDRENKENIAAKCKNLNDAIDFFIAMKPPLEEVARYCGEQSFTTVLRKSINTSLSRSEQLRIEYCGKGTPSIEADNSCSPTSHVESLSEKIGPVKNTYEEVVIDNNCKQRVRFQYSISSKNFWTNCAPPMRSGYHTGNRTSSTDMASLKVAENWESCK